MRLLIVIIAVLLAGGGFALIFNVARVTQRLGGRAVGKQSWYMTPEGWRWEGVAMVVMGWLFVGVVMITSSEVVLRNVGAAMMVAGVLAAAIVIVYGGVRFARYGRR